MVKSLVLHRMRIFPQFWGGFREAVSWGAAEVGGRLTVLLCEHEPSSSLLYPGALRIRSPTPDPVPCAGVCVVLLLATPCFFVFLLAQS